MNASDDGRLVVLVHFTVQTCVCVGTCVCVCACLCACVCMCLCVHIRTCMHPHDDAHTGVYVTEKKE